MRRRRLGRTDLELSVVGLGTWVFGGRWGGADDADSRAACHAALDAGVNWIDTADIYGQGRAEEIVGRVLRERRDEVVVATKGGVAWELEPSFRIWRQADGPYLRAALEHSLARLGLDHVDLYQVHWPVSGVPAEETIGALTELKSAGLTRAIGVSNYSIDDLRAAQAIAPVDSLQVGYHVMRRDVEADELAFCAAQGIGVLAYGPLAHGLLTGKMTATTTFPPSDWRAQSELFADDAFPARIEVARELAALARESGRVGGVSELAVAWVLRRAEVTSVIVGARTAEQARADAALAAAPLTDDEAARVEEILARHPEASRHYGHGEPPDPQAD